MIISYNGRTEQLPDDTIAIEYEEEVSALIRAKYSVSDELAILRQRDTKPEEFAEYNAYCEECKRIIKNRMSEANNEG